MEEEERKWKMMAREKDWKRKGKRKINKNLAIEGIKKLLFWKEQMFIKISEGNRLIYENEEK